METRQPTCVDVREPLPTLRITTSLRQPNLKEVPKLGLIHILLGLGWVDLGVPLPPALPGNSAVFSPTQVESDNQIKASKPVSHSSGPPNPACN